MTKRSWLSESTYYEGLPIYLRRPYVPTLEIESLRLRFRRLICLTHVLKHFKKNGLPEAAYNNTLAVFDTWLLGPFVDETNGVVALVETFAGKRTYYIYTSDNFDVGAFVFRASKRFPTHEIVHESEEDPTWRVFRGYARDFSVIFPA